jgi:heme/copper-type cytochrome/quinol oxidase subunit 4
MDLEELVDLDIILVEMVAKEVELLVLMVVLTLAAVVVVLLTQVERVEQVVRVLLLSDINSNKYLKK